MAEARDHQSIKDFHRDMHEMYKSYGLNGEGKHVLAKMETLLQSCTQVSVVVLQDLQTFIEKEEQCVRTETARCSKSSGAVAAKPQGRDTRHRKRSASSSSQRVEESGNDYLKWLYLYKHFVRALERNGPFVRSKQVAGSEQEAGPIGEKSLDSTVMIANLDAENDELQSDLRDLRNQLNAMQLRLTDVETELGKVQQVVNTLPARDEIAKYDIVYAFITDLKRLTGNKYVRIENVQDPAFANRYGNMTAVRTLLDAIDRNFGTIADGRCMPGSGCEQFLSVTKAIADMHGTTGHLSIEERTKVYNYQRLWSLCDDTEEQQLLQLLRDIPGRNRDWPLAPTS